MFNKILATILTAVMLCEMNSSELLRQYNSAMATARNGGYEAALEGLDALIKAEPGYIRAHYTRGLFLLAFGRFSEGWRECEWRLKLDECKGDGDKPAQWDGTPIGNATLLVNSEQGIGDTFQFLRYLKVLRDRNVRFAYRARDFLKPFLGQVP